MERSIFIRVLDSPIEEKGVKLSEQIDNINALQSRKDIFIQDTAKFSRIIGSPFSYWASDSLLELFGETDVFESDDRTARVGLSTTDDFRFLRVFWEVPTELIARSQNETLNDKQWVTFGKGGIFSPYYSDLHVVLNWRNDGEELKDFIRSKGDSPSRNIRSESLYFMPGLTWPLRASQFAPYALPKGSIFGVRGYAILAPVSELIVLLGILNSKAFDYIYKLSLGRSGYPEFVVGVLKKLPWVEPPSNKSAEIDQLALECFNIKRDLDTGDEVTNTFKLPAVLQIPSSSLLQASVSIEEKLRERSLKLLDIQDKIDEIAFSLYRLSEEDVELIQLSTEDSTSSIPKETVHNGDANEAAVLEDLPNRAQNLLMWCIGAAFGRWDVRFAIDQALLPELQGPLDPLPRCAPGALVGTDGLPAKKNNIASEAWLLARENVLDVPEAPLADGEAATIVAEQYPLPVAWDGILVDDATHPADLVNRVRQVLALLWGERAGDIEKEACEILGVKSLRDYFRDPRKGFFPFHIKRYSKSRRKAPIYWLLQSENRNYAIWLYIHRMDDTTYFNAARNCADTKVNLETTRLEELRQGFASLDGSALKRREREIERQQKLVSEVTTFRNKLDEVALSRLTPDLNDGVIISIAPLWELVPWKEAGKMWQQLEAGKYEWSSMAQKMRQRGLVKE